MNNEEYINRYWRKARSELKTLRRVIVKTNKRTQDKLQDLFDSLKITFNDLNRTLPKNLKEKLLRKIEEWKENNVYKGFFEFKAKQLLKGNITYRSYLEIMIFGIYMEEMSKIDELSTATFQTISSEYLNRGREELGLEPRRTSIMPELLFMTVNGLRWIDYLSGLYVTNAEEIEKEYLILSQAGKEPNVNDGSMQKLFQKQVNWLINIKDKPEERYSGGIDEYATAYANESYLNASEENQKVMFVSDLCENVTKMCRYMDGMIFNTKDKNVFRRPFGRTLKELKIEKIITKGLVVGVNMPPINYHFHWCHSTFTYQIDKEVKQNRKEIFKRKKK